MTESFSHQSDEVLTTLREISVVIQSAKLDFCRASSPSTDVGRQISGNAISTPDQVRACLDQTMNRHSPLSPSTPESCIDSEADESLGLGVARGVLLMASVYVAIAAIAVTVIYGMAALAPSAGVIVMLAILVHRLLAPLFVPDAVSPHLVSTSPVSGRPSRRFSGFNISPAQ